MVDQSLQLKIVVLPEEREKAIELLKQSELPTLDLDEDKLLFLLWTEDEIIGTGGLEIFGEYGLIRSISVIHAFQGKGYGRYITYELEKLSADRGVRYLYLLTTTARSFFEKLGYREVKRENVADSIRQSSEFSTVCPSSASVMIKDLI